MSSFREVFLFLIKIIFELYFLVVLFRFIFDYFKIQTTTLPQVAQYMYKITDPLLHPLQKYLPTYKGIDLAILTLLFLIKAVELLFIALLAKGGFPGLLSLIIWPIGEILSTTLNLFCVAVIVVAIMSWFMPQRHTPITAVLFQMTDIFLQPARRMIPPVGGFDISPLVVLVVLKIIDILIAVPLIKIGISLA